MENNSKQILLSIIGLIILVITVVGVSFAFFTYYRTGKNNNTVTTGKIIFDFTGDNGLSLQNQFPKTATDAINGDDAKSFNFAVTGTIPKTAPDIDYQIYAIQGDPISGKTLMDGQYIRLYLNSKTEDGGTVIGTYGDPTQGGLAGDLTKQLLLATGTIKAGQTIDHQYSLYMWIDENVLISDTDPLATFCAHEDIPSSLETGEEGLTCVSQKPVYSNLYYSVKIKVVAGDEI